MQAAAQELRAAGIHVALLAVDATIESPKTAEFTRDVERDALADMGEVARAVSYLVEQAPRALTHELSGDAVRRALDPRLAGGRGREPDREQRGEHRGQRTRR